jgi:TolB-like protein
MRIKMIKRDKLENKKILDSWKEISKYLNRDIRTCFRWEKELGLPVHRIDHTSPRSKVFAYKSEIDEWLKEKANHKELQKKPFLENRRLVIGLLSSFVLLSAIFAFLYFARIRPFGPSTEIPSIAVLQFQNLSAKPQEQYFSTGLTNEIIYRLSMLSDLKVISSGSVFRYRDSDKSTKEIGRELHVDYVLKGIVEKVDKNFELSVQLIRIKNNKEIWSQEYKEALESRYLINDDIIARILETLDLNIAQNHPAVDFTGRPLNYEAYEAYWKGKLFSYNLNGDDTSNKDPLILYHKGKYYSAKSDRENNEQAIVLFSQAINLDSSFALAYVGLAGCYSNYVNFGWDFDKKLLVKAENLVEKAQAISPDLPEYYSTLVEIYLLKDISFNANTLDIAFELAQEGIKKYPNDAQLNSIIGYCYYLKFGQEGNEADFKKALEFKEKSRWLDPLSINNIAYTELLMLNREYYKAINICNNIRQISPFMVDFRLAEIYYYMGDLYSSETIFQKFQKPLNYKITSKACLGMIASQRGEKGKVLNLVGEINLLSSQEEKLLSNNLILASVYFGLGEKEMGYEYLKSFFSEDFAVKFPYIFTKYINIDRNFDRFKQEKEFKKIIKGENEWQEAKPSE